jgi:hypothetical protein
MADRYARAVFALKGGGACARSANRIENDRNGVLIAWAVIWLNPCRHNNALALGPGGEKTKHDPCERFIEPLELPYEVQRVSVRVL